MRRWLARELARRDKTLVGFWPFQDNILDYSGEAYHGNYAPSGNPHDYLIGYANKKGIFFNGTNFIDCGKGIDLALEYNNRFSISLWFIAVGANASGTLISHDLAAPTYGSVNGYSLILTSDNHLRFSVNNTSFFTVPFSPILFKWYHITLTYDGSDTAQGVNIYVNDKAASPDFVNNSVLPSFYNSSANLTVGRGTYGYATNLVIGLIRIWNRLVQSIEVVKFHFKELNLFARLPHYKGLAISAKNNSVTFFIRGGNPANKNIPLFMYRPIGAATLKLNMFMKTFKPLAQNKSFPLSIFGAPAGKSGKFTTLPLYINTSNIPVNKSASLNMYIRTVLNSQCVNNMNLYVAGQGFVLARSVPLFINNTARGASVPFTITGSGVKLGIPYNKSINLFLARQPSSMITLFTKAPSPGSGTVPLYIKSLANITKTVPLTMKNPIGAANSGPRGNSLFISGF